MNLVSSTSFSVLWNGDKKPEFSPSRGIRQGDPLSPYLFVLCVEKLSRLIAQLVSDGNWKPIRIGTRGPLISHMFFADDLLFMGEGSEAQDEVMLGCLHQFCEASGQRVSFEKSRVWLSPNTPRQKKWIISSKLGMQLTSDLGKYLGVPMLHGRVTKAIYEELSNRVQGRLAGWKMSQLSMAGRTVLVQSAASTIATYTMQSTKLPTGVCRNIDMASRKFIWGELNGKRKLHLLPWDTLCKPKNLGIKENGGGK